MTAVRLRRVDADAVISERRFQGDPEVERRVERILAEIRSEGEPALRRWAVDLGDLAAEAPLVIDRDSLRAARDALSREQWEVLTRVARRIQVFAERQRESLSEFEAGIPGGRAGQRIVPVEVAGCYAPGGRYPLPSSVLMTAVTARAAGVGEVWVASPRPSPATLAAAAIAGVDGVLAVGGAQAVAALAFGVGGVPACDVVVGPGSVWVTAAKRLLVGEIGIDSLAGPSELAIVVDSTAEPEVVAADLLAQAEHDALALPILVSSSESMVERVERELERQLVDLPTRETALAALETGFAVVTRDRDESIEVANRLAPEHLQIMTRESDEVARRCRRYGGLFIGSRSAEVLGDYGAGPNHTLPTGGTARFAGGLSVLDFLCVRTWIEIDSVDDALELYEDAAMLAEMEGLEAHRRAALRRITSPKA